MSELKDITDIMDHLSPHKQAEIIDDLMTKYGVPRTFVVDLLEMLGFDAKQADELIIDNSPMMLKEEA